MDKILEVKNLKVSFRTTSGTVKAVRDISFDLERGRTLAIVGESGSGKSVTSKAILGILAGNSIIEGGEILYDGKDLLKINEDEMYKIRGDKISMIFQDPLSSLNPIVKIGKQITEAMLLKNKASRKDARKEFNSLLGILEKNMAAATGDAAKAKSLCSTFDKFCIQANKLENSYNIDDSNAEALEDHVEDFLFRASKKQKLAVKDTLRSYQKQLRSLKDPFYTAKFQSRLDAVADRLGKVSGDYTAPKGKNAKIAALPESIISTLEEMKALLKDMRSQVRPDFFRIGLYSLDHPGEKLYEQDIRKLNEDTLVYLQEHFMNEFLPFEDKAVAYSAEESRKKKGAVLAALKEARTYFAGEFDKNTAMKLCKELSDKVEDSIDRLEIVKDSYAYTFRSSLSNGITRYFFYKAHNPKEEARFARQSKKRDALIAKGRNVDWKVVPKVVFDLEDLQADILSVIDQLTARYESATAHTGELNSRDRSVEIVDFLKEKASKVVYRVTRAMAKEKAIKLMDEVGIAEPRMRFNQYPFEFSGGMRQRIVIAIALSADPEILICDEPTTALDVTIQAQILELINRLKAERSLSVIFITHDLGVVANMADDIAVMYAGKIVEFGTADDIFYDPRHPYTWALLSSMPDLDTKEKLDAIPGTPPNMIYPPVGDAFADRNKYAMKIDFEMQPPMFQISDTHKAATWLLHPDAPKVQLPKIITDRIARMKKAGEQNG